MEIANSEVVRKLSAKLLRKAGRDFARHGCNDMDKDFLDGVSKEDQFLLEQEMNKWNCPSSDPSQFVTIDRVPDFFWMTYLAHKLDAAE